MYFDCPSCSKTFAVESEHLGLAVACPHCQTTIQIPAAAAAPAPAPIPAVLLPCCSRANEVLPALRGDDSQDRPPLQILQGRHSPGL